MWPGNEICSDEPSSALIELNCLFLEIRLDASAVSSTFRKV